MPPPEEIEQAEVPDGQEEPEMEYLEDEELEALDHDDDEEDFMTMGQSEFNEEQDGSFVEGQVNEGAGGPLRNDSQC